MAQKVRVRFAPSPTGGLHLGGVRTVLYNYLFARQHSGDFILRIEDTDQNRFVPGAEQYILDCLAWCGLQPDESPVQGGAYGPYRQSERKKLYKQYAEQLIEKGQAYYAFDTPGELEAKRAESPNFQYSHASRSSMKNSLTLPWDEVNRLLEANTPHVIRIKMPADEEISFTDMIRGEVKFNASQSDDKVLLKADEMPTYHLAVVVDDYLMKISHAFRGEEWLPSAPVHVLLWKYLFGLENMPQWAHLPLILKPDGHGKLSKRDGDRLGFPVFAMDWLDPKTQETIKGFKELGFLPEAFINLLAMLGWNDGTEQEIFSLEELLSKFSIERIHKGGAKFDFEKAKWYNHEWIKSSKVEDLRQKVKTIFSEKGITAADDTYLDKVIALVKDRCTLLPDFIQQASFFFETPNQYDLPSIQPKWNGQKELFFSEVIRQFELMQQWDAGTLEKEFKELAAANQVKPGDVLLPFRIMLVGGKFGPAVFDIAALIGKKASIERIKKTISLLTIKS
jgi:glutamyl-tRNA synthetase